MAVLPVSSDVATLLEEWDWRPFPFYRRHAVVFLRRRPVYLDNPFFPCGQVFGRCVACGAPSMAVLGEACPAHRLPTPPLPLYSIHNPDVRPLPNHTYPHGAAGMVAHKLRATMFVRVPAPHCSHPYFLGGCTAHDCLAAWVCADRATAEPLLLNPSWEVD